MHREVLIFIGAVLGLLGLIIGGCVWLGNTLDEGRCANTAAAMGVEYRYSINTPCMVEHKGRFVPLEAFKVIQ